MANWFAVKYFLPRRKSKMVKTFSPIAHQTLLTMSIQDCIIIVPACIYNFIQATALQEIGTYTFHHFISYPSGKNVTPTKQALERYYT